MTVYLNQRITAISQLGSVMGILANESQWPGFQCGLAEAEFQSFKNLIETQYQYNGWFTKENVEKALKNWSQALMEENLRHWLERYEFPPKANTPLQIGIICAGNVPMVGLHDILCVLLSGNKAIIKFSSNDDKLIPALLQLLVQFDPIFIGKYEMLNGKMIGQNAIIATGSNNTSRYFHYYFKNIPHIIRKSRTSIAILDGSESTEELKALGNDIFDYFGLGCRNVSKIYVPDGYDLNLVFTAIYGFNQIVNHNKYANNYDYNKAVWLLNLDNLLDNGFVLLKEEKQLASPTASLYYEFYSDRDALRKSLETNAEQIQCVISKADIAFGHAQKPDIWDYADNIDTMQFLMDLPA